MNGYQQSIAEHLAKLGRGDIKPHHVEGYMRCQYGTLDALTRDRFKKEVKISVACIDQGGVEAAEELAASFGLEESK